MDMTLADMRFDAVFCLNLERRPDRKKHAEQQFAYLGLTPTFYTALDVTRFNLDISGYFKPGMVGCYVSHLAILHHCILNGYQRVLITEDDLNVITGGKSLLSAALPVLPSDWQFVYLGYSVFAEQRIKTQYVNDYWCIPGGCWGTQAYMINGLDSIKRLFSLLQQPKQQIDIDLSFTVLPKSGLKYYGITPSAIKQLQGRSDVQ